MVKSLTVVGNSKAVILPNRLVKKYNLSEVEIREHEGGILIMPVGNGISYEQRLDQLKRDKKLLYKNMKMEAADNEVIKYYDNNTNSDVDVEIFD